MYILSRGGCSPTGDALKHETMFFQQYGLAKVNKLHGQGKVRKHMVGQDAENKIAGPPAGPGRAGPGRPRDEKTWIGKVPKKVMELCRK